MMVWYLCTYYLPTLFHCGIRIKVDLPFLLKKKWTRAKRDGSLSDPINHAKSSAAVFFHWHVSIWKSLPLGPIQITLESISSFAFWDRYAEKQPLFQILYYWTLKKEWANSSGFV